MRHLDIWDPKGPLVHQCLCSSLLLIDFQDEAFEYFLSACFLAELTNYSVQINWSKRKESLDECALCNERESAHTVKAIACIIQGKPHFYLNYLDLGVKEMQ